MKSKRPQPLDLSRAMPPQPEPTEMVDAPEDLDFQPPEFNAAAGGAIAVSGAAAPVAASTPELPALGVEDRAGRVRQPRAWPFYLVAAAVSAAWALAPIMFAWGYRREIAPFANDPFALAVLALLAVGPMALVWLSAYVAHQGAKLAAETRRAQMLADTLLQPAALAARGAGTAVEVVRREIEQATTAAAQARDELGALRDVLASESRALIEAAEASGRTAAVLTENLSGEREKMGELSGRLDAQAASVADTITRHARMVAEASDLAETQIREAEAALAARAADLAAAAGEASDAARIAGEDLARQIARLETAGLGVGDQVRTVEESLTGQRAALVTVAHGLRADQEAFAAEAESQRAQLQEIAAHAREGASAIDETALRGAETLRELIAETGMRLRELTDIASDERGQLSEAAARSLNAVVEAAVSERHAIETDARQAIEALTATADEARRAAQVHAEEARRAAEEHAQLVRDRIDQLSEAAFTAGQRADVAFDARINEARGLVDQSARLVEEAGARTAAQLAQGVSAARETLAQLEDLLAHVDERIARLPADAESGAEQVRASLARGMEALMASARRAAEETQSIDAAFQDRVRRNYDMLSEAVRLMGVVAGAASTSAPPPRTASPPPPSRIAPPAEPTEPFVTPQGDAADSGLRPRLKLTPTASDSEFKTVFESAGGREPPEAAAEGWTWKELLSSMDDAPPSDESLASVLIGEIEAMGIDAAALLPRPRIDEIAAAFHAGDEAGGMEVVRRFAPAAIRRLSRRMLSDRRMRAQAERYAGRYRSLWADGVGRGESAVMAAALLGSDQGRAFLLLEAALAEVA